MERIRQNLWNKVDWATVILFVLLVTMGWLNIFAAVYIPGSERSMFDLSLNSGKQLLWIAGSLVLVFMILITDIKVYYTLAYLIYAAVMLTLVGVLLFGREVAGSKSWLEIGSFARFQPSELAKFATALALARFLSDPARKLMQWSSLIPMGLLILLPVALILLQKDTGSALVYTSLILVFYREGLPGYLMVLGLYIVGLFVTTLIVQEKYLYHLVGVLSVAGLIACVLFSIERRWVKVGVAVGATLLSLGLVFGVEPFVQKVLQPHQQERIKLLINPDLDPRGVGWQVTQSKIAIGSGGIVGKGFLEGTQTKFDFVPDQSTDFIFCTIGEEHGWLGSMILLGLFIGLLTRLLTLAERQKSRFSRVYGYGVVAILFFHFTINIGMTIGFFPVIGIPLPFFSYGGSSLWSFTILLFVMVKLDTHRRQLIMRDPF